jgi:hypothetical protein
MPQRGCFDGRNIYGLLAPGGSGLRQSMEQHKQIANPTSGYLSAA